MTERAKKVDDELNRGHRAHAIVTDPMYIEAMQAIKHEVIDKWAACSARDTDGREWLWQHYQVALKFEEILTTMINTGKMAKIEREQSASDKVRAFFKG